MIAWVKGFLKNITLWWSETIPLIETPLPPVPYWGVRGLVSILQHPCISFGGKRTGQPKFVGEYENKSMFNFFCQTLNIKLFLIFITTCGKTLFETALRSVLWQPNAKICLIFLVGQVFVKLILKKWFCTIFSEGPLLVCDMVMGIPPMTKRQSGHSI